jgi:hypothetical protein
LADENVERQAALYLEKRDHEVEMVVDVLSPGVDDEAISTRADERDQVVLTSDSDFLSRQITTLYVPNDELDSFSLADIVDTIADHVEQEQLPSNTYVTDTWS